MDYSGCYTEPEWEKIAYRQREILERYGVAVEQTHAPFNRYGQYDRDAFWEYYRNLFATSKILGAKYVVVHAAMSLS